MEKSLSRTEPANSTEPDIKKALLRIAAFFLVFFTSYLLLLWLHPIGAHHFLWSLALGACIFWLTMTRLRSWISRGSAGLRAGDRGFDDQASRDVAEAGLYFAEGEAKAGGPAGLSPKMSAVFT
jgi:hypothetical protein